ncbi:TPA: TM2 domain-containing protein [Streptococcus agalactiae]|uniref:TM2 domain-containing protein n=1 Tax=Streptococcus agalactiae TaxID=1311 RepID=UPI000EB12D3D|nr:TM2 domain-containing protein [Streptococcus agalactiae]MCC9822970.1 TM2 domain-containing protein [Streptococcus agalactiae]MCK6315372.1 TM2 domain-containing protein [Streptococcus agalactiae]RKX10460.1 NINE protein [Streptococcus agalactiae]VEJ26808.1 phage super infection exclusion [Streptococcus agalactiae]HEN0442453.1 TM2 domain-containing protein [Streptococcus agalactiae]
MPRKGNKVIYVLLALFLGEFGLHKFYAGKTGTGILYLIFCWTFIPGFIGVVEGILAILKSADQDGNFYI